jgi:hypothetical protein
MGVSKPIADLFPDCTVYFSDIANFTAWSSVREPSQVFILLESIYGAFDKVNFDESLERYPWSSNALIWILSPCQLIHLSLPRLHCEEVFSRLRQLEIHMLQYVVFLNLGKIMLL